jgi:hypothetical protein
MNLRTFMWSLATGLAPLLVYALLSRIARALVRLRASLLGDGPEADRLREEWSATLWELRSQSRQLSFALLLFKDFNRLQTEIEFRADLQLAVERRVSEYLEGVDIASVRQYPQRIRELEERLGEVEEDRAEFHCPYCDSAISGVSQQDYPEHHCMVTYESFGCGYVTADGYEEAPCPYGPNWPALDDFDFITKKDGDMWI